MRIRYTHQEWQALADAWPTTGPKALWVRWEKASLALPPERRRQFHPSAGTVIKRLLAEAPAPTPAPAEPPTEAELYSAPESPPLSASDLFIDQLIARLVPVLVEALRPLLPAPVTMYEKVLKDRSQALPGVMPMPRPRILVAGVRGGQKYELKQVLKDRLPDAELVFWGVEEAASLLKARARGASHTIVWTKFISHAHEQVVREATNHWSRWPGGMDGLKEEVERAANLYCADGPNGG